MSKKYRGGRELELVEILKLLISTLRTLGRNYICIDALDEFPEEFRPEFFKSLKEADHSRITRHSAIPKRSASHSRGSRKVFHWGSRDPNYAN